VKRERRDEATAMISAETELTGTPGYMAPEAILGHADIDRRVDIYAVGCVAYFLLTGERVFGAANMMTVLMQHVQEEPMPPSHGAELQIPREVDEFVLACLRKDPKRRPASAEELLQMASACKTADLWDQRAARKWWEAHLPQLATPAKANTPTWDVSARCSPAEKAPPWTSGLTTLRDNAMTTNSNS
jgi:eukaryotic-like serine/threonine-protein kinase